MSNSVTLLKILKGDVHHLPATIISTIIATSVYTFGWGFADPFYSIYLKSFSTHYATVGLFQTLAMGIGVLMLIPLAGLLDRGFHLRVIQAARLGYVGVALFYLLAGVFHSLPLLLIALILHGIFFPCIWTSTSARLSLLAPRKETGLTFGFYMTSYNAAWITGLLLAALIVSQLPLYTIFIPVMLFAFLSRVYAQRRARTLHEPVPTTSFRSALHEILYKDKLFSRVWQDIRSLNVEAALVYGVYFLTYPMVVLGITFLPLYASSIGMTFEQIGLLVFCVTLPFLFSLIAAEIGDRTERLRVIIVGFLIAALGFFLLSYWHSAPWHLYLFAFVFMTGYAMIVPSLSAVVTLLTKKKYRGTSIALLDVFIFCSIMLFSPLMGAVIDTYGWPTLFRSASIGCGLLALLILYMKRLFQRRNATYHQKHPHGMHDHYII